MTFTKLKIGMAVVVLVAIAAPLLWQRQQIKRLMTENGDLSSQLGQMASLRDSNGRLAAQYKASVEDSQADRRELMRLRAQSSRLRQVEQENAQLKAERQRMALDAAHAQKAAVSSEPTPGVSASDVKADTSQADVTDLGVVEFSDGAPTRLGLGAGKECMVTASLLVDGNLQIVFASATEIDGVPIQSEQTLTLAPGKRMAALINGVEVALTPALKTK